MKSNEFNEKVKSFMFPKNETHVSMGGYTVHHYHFNFFRDIFSFRDEITKLFGRETELRTNNGYVAEFFISEFLCNVSYCEGDVYVVFFENEKEMTEKVMETMKYYEENEGAEYDVSPELFLIFQYELLKEPV